MNKNRLYLFVIVGLLLSNILMAYYLFMGDGNHRPKPREVVIERLKFDEDQIHQFDEIIQQHQEQMAVKEEGMKILKYELYLCLNDTQNQATSDSLIMEIGIIQRDIENIIYSHFENIKKLCHNNQLNDFNKLANELAHLFAPF